MTSTHKVLPQLYNRTVYGETSVGRGTSWSGVFMVLNLSELSFGTKNEVITVPHIIKVSQISQHQ